MLLMSWPNYKSSILIKGNPQSQVGIITLFTQKEKVSSCLEQEYFALLGQLYNPSKGISILLRNCLANKNIRYLIVCGQDLSRSGEALIKLKKEGVEELYENNQSQGFLIEGLDEKRIIEKEISLDAINLFRDNVQILDHRSLRNFSELKAIIQNLKPLPSYGEPEFFPEPEIKVNKFPTDKSIFKIKSKYVGEAWLKVLDTIMRFGVVKKSDYAEDQKEVLNLTVVITDEDPDQIKWEGYFQFSKEHLEEYLPLVVSNKKVEGINYTYGSRLRSWRGIDQINSLIKRLKNSIYTRRAVAVTWDVEKDHENEEAPCLDLVQCIVQEDSLFMTAFFRSNDMFDGWPENALALRKLQYLIAEELSLKVGSLTTISGSSHIYERNWEKAAEILSKYPVNIEQLNDPRGNFVIYLKDNLIKVEHQSPEGVVLEIVDGKTAEEVCLKLAQKQKVSDIYHAFYLGRELNKAEFALKNGLSYEQEQELNSK